ncbi:MAG: hypothetical protein MJD61_19610 [Proteobacteria bacterium]|nr:hypothetical protein [Pseudomonadota bacterium]
MGSCLCPPPFVDCGSGCSDQLSDAFNCGACGIECGTGGICVAGVCQCPPGTIQCQIGEGGLGGTGCVLGDMQSDVNNCGQCGNQCAVGAACIGGNCQCPDGMVDCDRLCVDTSTNPAHCGGCTDPTAQQTRACAPGALCLNGQCECGPNLTLCGNACVDINIDPSDCGGCGNFCEGQSVCLNGLCQCPPGTVECGGGGGIGFPGGGEGGNCLLGSLQTDPNNCGECGIRCPLGGLCLNGLCQCPPGTQVCAANPGRNIPGECALTVADPEHCGPDCKPCVPGATCANGICLCPPGLTECHPDGCVDLLTSSLDCGQCGVRCSGGAQCMGGQCLCPPGREPCGTPGPGELSGCRLPGQDAFQNDSLNCGGCGRTCAVGAICRMGECLCPPGEVDCGGHCSLPGRCPIYEQCDRNFDPGGIGGIGVDPVGGSGNNDPCVRPGGEGQQSGLLNCGPTEACCVARRNGGGTWCGQFCDRNRDCPFPPPPSNAMPMCAQNENHCFLDCSLGQLCPLGMTCVASDIFGQRICAWN